MKIRLVLLPETKIDLLLKGYSRGISKKYETLFTLNENHIPHITITTITFDEELLPEVIKKAERLIRNTSPFIAKLNGVIHDGLGSISIHFKNIGNIKNIYKRL